MDELRKRYAKMGVWERKWSSHLRQIAEFEDLWHFLKKPAVFDASTVSYEALFPFQDVIALGGDGWVNNTSHFLTSQRMITINSDPEKSTGALSNFTVPSFKAKFHELEKGIFTVEYWTRLQARHNGEPIWPLALNDVCITANDPFDMSRYVIDYRGIQEEQKTTGVLVSTGTGSTGWHRNVHTTQQRESGIFSRDAQIAKFTVREVPAKPYADYQIVGGILEKGERLRLISYIDEMRIGPDSYKNYFTMAGNGDEITVEISDSPLRMVTAA